VRLGEREKEIPAVLTSDGEATDVSSVVRDFDSAFFAEGGIERVRAAVARGGLPVHKIGDLRVGAPVARPYKLMAVGLNYSDHAKETNATLPEKPIFFDKATSSINGPYDDIVLPSDNVDFEVELVVVIGRPARNVAVTEAWSYVAGLTAGQDISDRGVQLSGPPPQQFNIGKSFEGFAPIGPALVTVDEFADPDDIGIGCSLAGAQMQKSRTGEFVFSIPELVAYLSSVLALRPGDLIFTGTPSGIGWARDPRRMIAAGDELVTQMDTIGEMRNHFLTR